MADTKILFGAEAFGMVACLPLVRLTCGGHLVSGRLNCRGQLVLSVGGDRGRAGSGRPGSKQSRQPGARDVRGAVAGRQPGGCCQGVTLRRRQLTAAPATWHQAALLEP